MRTAVCCLTLLILLCIAPLAAEQLPAGQVGRVIALQGQVSAVNGGQVRPLSLRATVGLQDEIATAAGSRVQVMFIDHTVFSLGPNSRLRVQEYRFDREAIARFAMGQGTFRMVSGRIVERNPQGFTMQTPAATIGIRGTMTAHTIGENGEQHYALDLEGGHQVDISGGGGMQSLTFDGAALDVGADGTLGDVRTATGSELQALDQATGFDAGAGTDGSSGSGDGDAGLPGGAEGTEDGSNPADGTGTEDGTGDGTGEDGFTTTGDGTTSDDGTFGELETGGDATFTGTGFTADNTGDIAGSTLDDPTTTTSYPSGSAAFTHGYYGVGVNVYTAGSPGPGFVPGATYQTPPGRTIAGDNLAPTVHIGGVGSNPEIALSGSAEGDVGAITDVVYDAGGGTVLSWTGGVHGTHVYEGAYTCPVTGDVHMEWGYWELNDPGYVFPLTGSFSVDAQVSPVYQVLGVQTPLAELDALRTNSYIGNYSGSACGMYYEQVNAGIPLSGTFFCEIDFSANSIGGAFLDFSGNNVTLTNGSGVLGSNGEFQISFPTGNFPTGAATGTAIGSTFGPDGLYVGGTWTGSATGAQAVGNFTGEDTNRSGI